jgi:hypothetical protein
MATNDRNRTRKTYSFFRARPVDPLQTTVSGAFGIEVTGDKTQIEIAIDETVIPVLSGTNAFTGSVIVSGTLTTIGDLHVSGTVFADVYKANVISSSIIFESGSTIFGDDSADTHTFTGVATFADGLSGSLTELSSGESYIVGAGSVSIISSSNGQVIVSGSAADARAA